MKSFVEQEEGMSPDQAFAALQNLKQKLEENFIQIGQLLSMVKKRKLYLKKGYDNFKDFVETEYKINGALAAKLCSVFDLYITELDMDDTSLKEIGFDRLNMVKPFVAKGDWEIIDDWMAKAEAMPLGELKDHIKQIKNKEKDKARDMKDVLVEQYLEKMRTWFNCSQKELNFKLALYFQDADLEEVKKVIKARQRQFESDQQNSAEVKE